MKVWDVNMEHFIGDLGHFDNTREKHWVPRRLFEITDDLKYPEHSHPVLEGTFTEVGQCDKVKIFHCGHLPIDYMDYILNRYKQHSADSKIHTPEFLKSWKLAHLLGQYPVRPVNPVELPKQILDRYELDRDEFYFANRGLELKHFIDAGHWKEFFKVDRAVEFGCGKGPRVYALHSVGVKTIGYEISDFAVKNKLHEDVLKGDILDDSYNRKHNLASGLVIAYDVLEHIEYDKLNIAIKTLIDNSKKHILVSVPVLGDPNLEADPTHKIRETKEWWIKQFTDKGLKLIPTPEHFLFKEQLMIFEK